MSKLKRVILEYEDRTTMCSGEEAERFEERLNGFPGNTCNTTWGVVIGGTPEAGRKILEEDIPVGRV